MTRPLGKGEVESSILSCSTINSQENKAKTRASKKTLCAESRMNDSGTTAENWQGSYDDYFQRDRDLWRDERYAQRTYLYRYFRADGRLFYTGISNQPRTRHFQHADKVWWKWADVIRIERFPNRRLAEIAEWISIEDEMPDYNCKVRGQDRTFWPVPSRWYGEVTGWRFVGEFPAWFAIEPNGRIVNQIERPGWWRDGFTQEPLEPEDNLYYRALMASVPK